jgi:hypothetical protein
MTRAPKSKGKLPPFVPLHNETTECDAWRAMSHGARSLFWAIKRKMYHNNGNCFLAIRNACEMIGSSKEQVARWFEELEHYGFIVMTKPPSLGVNGKGRAARWRITELEVKNDAGNVIAPTRDYLRWNGVKFRRSPVPPHKRNDVPENRYKEKKQNPVPENRDMIGAENRYKGDVPENRYTFFGRCTGKPGQRDRKKWAGKPVQNLFATCTRSTT